MAAANGHLHPSMNWDADDLVEEYKKFKQKTELAFKSFLKDTEPEQQVEYQSHDLRVLKFSWHNCGSADDPVKVKDVTLTPDPVKLPGEVKTGFTAQLLKTMDKPLKAALVIKKKVLFAWIEVPCVDSVGSCTYTDLCAKIPGKPTDACPPPLSTYNIPCHCPFKAGNYTLPPSNFDLPSIGSLPEWLEEGDYSVEATISSNSTRLACYRAELSLTK